jgi:hypothetical protein
MIRFFVAASCLHMSSTFLAISVFPRLIKYLLRSWKQMTKLGRSQFWRLATNTGHAETKPVQGRDAVKYFTICPIIIICRYFSRSYIVRRKKNSECWLELMSRTRTMYLRYGSPLHRVTHSKSKWRNVRSQWVPMMSFLEQVYGVGFEFVDRIVEANHKIPIRFSTHPASLAC